MAAGNDYVNPDLYLTEGLVINKDRKQVALTIETFGLEQPEKLLAVATLRAPTDRSVLRDLGYDFVMRDADRRGFAGRTSVSAEDEDKYLVASPSIKRKSVASAPLISRASCSRCWSMAK